MIGMIGIRNRFEKLSEALWPSAVFWRTASFPCHAHLLKRFISEQHFFQQKLVLPAITEIVFVQQSLSRHPDHIANRGASFVHDFRESRLGAPLPLLRETKLVQMRVLPSHNGLQNVMELAQGYIPIDQNAPPDRGAGAQQGYFDHIHVH